jgi:anti-anti-sigma regulatory factor
MQSALVRESCEDGVDVVFMSGDVDAAHANEILQLFVGYRRHDKLILDLVAVDSLSTRVVAALVIGQALLDHAGCELVLRSVSTGVFTAFETTNTESIFTFVD